MYGIFYLEINLIMKSIKSLGEDLIPLSRKQGILIYIIIACVFQFVLFYTPVLADDAINEALAQETSLEEEGVVNNEVLIKEVEPLVPQENFLPLHEKRKVLSTSRHAMTAYNSDPRQTDDTPCITANGFNVCEHGIEDTIAANFLKFGTKVQIPELFGDRIFVVRDRMNKRYPDRVDIWFKNYDDAIKFGIRVATIVIVE